MSSHATAGPQGLCEIFFFVSLRQQLVSKIIMNAVDKHNQFHSGNCMALTTGLFDFDKIGAQEQHVLRDGRRHGFESGGGAILRAERAKKFLTPTFWPVGDKILLR